MGSLDEANNMPERFVFLLPGGCANYEIPVSKEEEQKESFLMVRPGKKEGAHRWDYKNKANISLAATTEAMLQTECSVKDSDGSKEASDYCMLNITSLVIETEIEIGVEVCVPQNETRNASIWELWVR